MQNNSNEQHDFFNNHNPSGNNLSKDNLEGNKNEFPISTLFNSEVKEGQMDTFGFGANNIHNDQNVQISSKNYGASLPSSFSKI